MTFGKIIRRARKANSLSQENLTKILKENYNVHVTRSYLSMLETNARINPSAKLISALLDYFNLPMSAAASLYGTAASQ